LQRRARRPHFAARTMSSSDPGVGFGAQASAGRFPFGFRARLILAMPAGTSTAAMMSVGSGGRTSRAAAVHCWRCSCSRTSASGTRQRKFSWGLTWMCPVYLHRLGSVAYSTATWSFSLRPPGGQASMQPAARATCTSATLPRPSRDVAASRDGASNAGPTRDTSPSVRAARVYACLRCRAGDPSRPTAVVELIGEVRR